MSYKDLKSYQGSVIIYDFTVEFCKIYLTNRSDPSNLSYRTIDQMIQAARSGKQNIVEASTERTSKKSEIKLLGVARASLQELLEDYEDFLRQRSLPLWSKDDPKARAVRDLAYRSDKTYLSYRSDRTDRSYRSYLGSAETAANTMVCLINQVNFLLDRQIKTLEEKFVRDGGYSESLLRKRLSYRNDKS